MADTLPFDRNVQPTADPDGIARRQVSAIFLAQAEQQRVTAEVLKQYPTGPVRVAMKNMGGKVYGFGQDIAVAAILRGDATLVAKGK